MVEKIKLYIRAALWICIVVGSVYIWTSPDIRVIPKHFGKSVAPEFRICVAAFQNLTGIAKIVPIRFAYLPEGILGTTYLLPFIPEIEINSNYWKDLKDGQCFLIWHELAHATCRTAHVSGEMPDGCATSIMNAYLPGNVCLRHILLSMSWILSKGVTNEKTTSRTPRADKTKERTGEENILFIARGE